MSDLSNPTDVARETLRLLAARRIAPTPANYQKIYQEIAGPAAAVESAGVEQVLKTLLRRLSQEMPGSSAATVLAEKALAERDWEGFEAGMLQVLGLRQDEQAVSWADLIRDLLRQWDLKQSGLTTGRKRRGWSGF